MTSRFMTSRLDYAALDDVTLRGLELVRILIVEGRVAKSHPIAMPPPLRARMRMSAG